MHFLSFILKNNNNNNNKYFYIKCITCYKKTYIYFTALKIMFKKLKIKNNKKLISQNLKSIFLLLFLILKRKISKYIQIKINISLKFLINNYEHS